MRSPLIFTKKSEQPETVKVLGNSKYHPAVDQGVHAFKAPSKQDYRSVCPALNTLANHGYIPHDGKHITFFTLSHALQKGYGISPAFADFLVFGGYILLRRNVLSPLDLHEIDRHGRIEHNASVAHDDDVDGSELAPTRVDPELLNKFIQKAYSPASLRASEDRSEITLQDMAYTRNGREAVSGPIDAMHAEIARGEVAMVLDIFGNGPLKTLNATDIEVWFRDNRFPADWSPSHQETLLDTVAESKKMRELMLQYRGGEPQSLLSDLEKVLNHEGQELNGFLSALGKTMGVLVQRIEKITRSNSLKLKTKANLRTAPKAMVNGLVGSHEK